MDMDFLYLRRIIAGVLSGAFIVGMLISINNSNIQAIINNKYYKFLGIKNTYIIDGKEVDTTAYDTEILNKTKNDDLSNNELIKMLKDRGITDTEALKASVTRIQSKLYEIKKDKLFIYLKCFVGFFTSMFVGSYIPILILYVQRSNRLFEMQEEVFQFNAILLILANHETASVKMVLEWMESFSDIFQKAIYKCINNLQDGEVKALKELQKDVKFKPFVRLIDDLIMAEDIKLQDSFQFLEQDRENNKEDRKEDNYRTVVEKTNTGRILGFLPGEVIIIGYVIAPLIWTSFIQLNSVIKNLNSMK